VKRWLSLLIVGILITGAVGAVFLIRGFKEGNVGLPRTFQNILEPGKNVSRYSISEVDFLNPTTKMYKITGRFRDSLFSQNGWIMGNFLLDGDLTQTPITVSLVPSDGVQSLGIQENEGTTNWETASSSEVMEVIRPNQPVELRFVFELDVQGNTTEQYQYDSIEKLKTDTSLEPGEYALYPHMVGIGGASGL